MAENGTVLVSCPIAGELSCAHLPVCSLAPGQIASLPAPATGEVLLTLTPEAGAYLPWQRRIRFSGGVPALPLPDRLRAEIWPHGLTVLHPEPLRVPTQFAVYPAVLQSRQISLGGQTYAFSRIRRETQALLISREGVPLSEVPLPEDTATWESIETLEPRIAAVLLEETTGRSALVLRLEPTGWQKLLEVPITGFSKEENAFVFARAFENEPGEERWRVDARSVRREAVLTGEAKDPGWLVLTGLRLGRDDFAARFLAQGIDADSLRGFLGDFTRILLPPIRLPVEDGCSVWGICGDEDPGKVRLYVFRQEAGRVTDLYQWE